MTATLSAARTPTMYESEEDFDRRINDYDSQDGYDDLMEEMSYGARMGTGAYIPHPNEIRLRQADLAWLNELRFTEEFIVSVMHHNTPDIVRVRELLLEGKSPQQVERLYKPFLEN